MSSPVESHNTNYNLTTVASISYSKVLQDKLKAFFRPSEEPALPETTSCISSKDVDSEVKSPSSTSPAAEEVVELGKENESNLHPVASLVALTSWNV